MLIGEPQSLRRWPRRPSSFCQTIRHLQLLLINDDGEKDAEGGKEYTTKLANDESAEKLITDPRIINQIDVIFFLSLNRK